MSTPTTDCLTTQAPELLLQIIGYIPSKDFLSLLKTNQALNKLVKANSKSICNSTIGQQFHKSAAIFKTKMINGWLTPTNLLVHLQEQTLIESKLESCPCCRWNPDYVTRFQWELHQQGDPEPATSCPIEHTSSLRIQLSNPGPQFLSFLERYDSKIAKCWDYTMGDKKIVMMYGEKDVQAEFEDKIGIHVRNFLRRLDETGEEGGYRATSFERALGKETRGGLEWFYGADGVGIDAL